LNSGCGLVPIGVLEFDTPVVLRSAGQGGLGGGAAAAGGIGGPDDCGVGAGEAVCIGVVAGNLPDVVPAARRIDGELVV